MNKPLCIIPARGGSKRFPRKNIALLVGKPLLCYAIEAAIKSDIFDCICVSSEDKEILGVASSNYVEVLALKRPEELARDSIQVKDVCLYLLGHFANKGKEYSEFAVLLPTNPLRTIEDIQSAYYLFRIRGADCLMSLVPYSHPPQRAVWVPDRFVKLYFGSEYMKRTQLLEKTYRHDGSFIFAKSEVFRKEKKFYGPRVVPYFINPERSVDIDSPLDLEWAEFLLGRKNEN